MTNAWLSAINCQLKRLKDNRESVRGNGGLRGRRVKGQARKSEQGREREERERAGERERE